MEALTIERRLTAFRATDAFAIEAYRAAAALRAGPAGALVEHLRRAALASGGALVAASASEAGSETERRHLERARSALVESRYYLYLARRFGVIDGKRYRGLTVRQDAALRELDSVLLRAGAEPRRRAPPRSS